MTHGCYFGPYPDIDSHMTYKILKPDGQIFHRSTLCLLTTSELAAESHKLERQIFDKSIATKLEPKSTAADFSPEELTPECETYEEDDPSSKMPAAPAITFEPITPDANDNHMNDEIVLPRGDTPIERGRVMGEKYDADDNPVGRAHANPILDTRRYDVEFDDGQVTEFTANIITESMYSQCDPDGNQYELLNAIVDFCKKNTAL